MNILDIFLSKETKNLQKINKLANRFNLLMTDKNNDVSEYSILWYEFQQIDTVEHKDKIHMYQEMIGNIINIKLKKILWQK